MGPIVVPVDFEEASRRAITVAEELAPRLGSEIILVHVYDFPTYSYPGLEPIVLPGIQLEVKHAAERALAELAQGTSMRTVLRLGGVAPELLAVIDEVGAGLVCMGTHGRRGVTHFLLGSVAEKIVRQSPVPVMTVRAP